MEWRKISEDKPLEPGDKVRLKFKAPGPWWINAAEGAVIEAALARKEDEGFRCTKIDYMTPGKMIFYFDIVKNNPAAVTILLIISAIMITPLAVALTFEEAEQAFDSPVVTAAAGTALIIAIAYLYKTLRG